MFKDNIKGSVFMMGCMAAYASNDALMKLVFLQLGFFQAIFLRGLVTILLLSIIVILRHEFHFRISARNKIMLALRTIGEIGATFCFLGALAHMPLANATAIMQSVPLVITLAAAIFLGETVGWRRWLSILIGFVGVLMIVRPGMEEFNVWSLLTLLAVVLVVLRDLATRELTAEASASFTSLIAAIVLTIMSLLLLPVSDWNPLILESFSLLTGAAGILIFGYLFSIMAMRVGEISFISPFRYSILLFSIFFGAVIFDEYPDTWTLIGSAIIITTGLYTIHRENRHRLGNATSG